MSVSLCARALDAFISNNWKRIAQWHTFALPVSMARELGETWKRSEKEMNKCTRSNVYTKWNINIRGERSEKKDEKNIIKSGSTNEQCVVHNSYLLLFMTSVQINWAPIATRARRQWRQRQYGYNEKPWVLRLTSFIYWLVNCWQRR